MNGSSQLFTSVTAGARCGRSLCGPPICVQGEIAVQENKNPALCAGFLSQLELELG
jgi:hypothetical protein